MFKRILRLPLEGKSSIFLFGPRGTGKTYWIKHHVPNSFYFDLLDFSLYNTLLANPGQLSNLIPPGFTGWVILDEIQRVPELLNQVHRLIESKGIRFLLTGSSARGLRRSGVNLLAGRALTYHMHPLTQQELGEVFNAPRALKFGLLPSVIEHDNPEKYLQSYVQTYIREEVVQEGLTRNISAFARFLETANFSQGQVLNISEIARELALNRLLVASYFEILEDLLLAIRISPFTHRAKRKIIAHQKFYFFDAGVYNILRQRGPLDIVQEVEGAGLETLFLQSLRAINDYYELGYSIYFWRTASGQEVDFVLYGPRGLHAFELKRSASVTPRVFKGLHSFAQDYPEAKKYVVYQGEYTQYHNDIQVLPLEMALQTLPELLG